MKRSALSFVLIVLMLFSACNQNPSAGNNDKDSLTSEREMGEINVSKNTGSMKAGMNEMVGAYLQIKNALAKDKGKEAGAAGSQMVSAFTKVDHTALNENQKKEYLEIAEDAKEHAEHISTNASKIGHQREHFDMLSQDMYELVKMFGADKVLYLDHCPMYNKGKGANWLSETKEINNPYLGSEMLTCGTVKEELK